ncbi:ABC-2 type transport system permease protein [Evansella vedderi]|uniref:ABC-2 type transport system permease protein n=1 Tax=Evansella vedderi TaxID=38282 RepID=A0ABT9ZVL5_9BACI|nr:ABC transporter permease [Evansella vedderi]MDQ0255286.1 ABC-2 type transport system permease protein [Evansella vedderi]
MFEQYFMKTGSLARFILRRDRIRIPIWLISIVAITLVVAEAFTNLYASETELQAIAETMLNPAMTAMVGQGYGLDNYTYGAMMAHQMLLFTAIAVAIMSILLVTRHTRTDEEDGRIEMIRSLPAGRLSSLSATLIVLISTNVVLAIFTGVGLYSLGIESMDWEGSLLYGSALGATGIFFAALTALFAQLSESSRGTIGLTMGGLILAYLIRAIGDVTNETLTWFSPLGWVLRSEVYVNNYWWPITFMLVISIVLIVASLYLSAIRDLGAGFLPSKPGRKHASPMLQSPLGLSYRIQRTALLSWAVGMFILGASYGSVFGDLDAFFSDIEIMEQMLTPMEGFSLTEQFITMLMAIMSMLGTVPVLMAFLKLKGEEKKNRTELLLSHAVSRTKLIGSYLIIAFITGFVMLSLAAIGLWAASVPVMDEPIAFSTIYGAALVYLPAVWMMTGIAVLLVGVAPNFTVIIWLYLVFSYFVVYLGGLLQFPLWLSNLTPFGYIPQLPVEEMNITNLTLLTLIAATMIVIGAIGYNKRDIEG